MINVAIIGATGYAGAELARILMNHPEAEVVSYGSKSYEGQDFSSVYGNFRGMADVPCENPDLSVLSKKADVIFTATPQGYLAGCLTEDILKNCCVIDLSADYRLKDVDVYEQWYKLEHKSPKLISDAVYGLCELHRKETVGKRLVANPGCYTTCSILTAYPLVKAGYIENQSLIIDAKSGTSGAGRGAKTPNLFCEVNESMKAYGVASHRHTPEIEQELSQAAGEEILINFTPHLVPMHRGILVTEYADLKQVTYADGHMDYPNKEMIQKAYEDAYKDEYFIRLLPDGMPPETKWVEGSNFVDISYVVDQRTHRVIMMGALDNLVKGAAGQAVQNMNILFGLPENTGLQMVPLFP